MFLIVGLAVVGAGVGMLYVGTEKNHLELTGTVQQVRLVPLTPDATFVVADFRVRNPSNVPFVVKDVEMILDMPAGEPVHGVITTKADIATMFEYQKDLGPKLNNVLGLGDKINAMQFGDFMMASRFDISEAKVNSRKGIHLRIHDLEGTIAEISGR
jgi:hypothetical protein